MTAQLLVLVNCTYQHFISLQTQDSTARLQKQLRSTFDRVQKTYNEFKMARESFKVQECSLNELNAKTGVKQKELDKVAP